MKNVGKFIPPILNQAEIDAITAPVSAELVYNSTIGELQYFNGSTWQSTNGTGGGGDDKLFRVSSTDSVSGYHEDKVIGSDSILWETLGTTNKTRRPYINPNYNFEFNGTISINGALEFGPAVTVNINTNTNNLLIPTLGSSLLIRLNFTGNYSLTGIVPNDVTKGQWIIIINVGTGQGSLKDNDAASLAENRFLLGANKTIQTNEGIALVYDTVDTRWRSFAINI